jgi:hypothetical protein
MSDVASLHHSDSRRQLAAASSELRRKLRAGEPCRSEDLLSNYPELASDPACATELIVEEYRLRRALLQDVTPGEYLERFPHLRTTLEERFRGLQDAGGSASSLTHTFDGPTLTDSAARAGPRRVATPTGQP